MKVFEILLPVPPLTPPAELVGSTLRAQSTWQNPSHLMPGPCAILLSSQDLFWNYGCWFGLPANASWNTGELTFPEATRGWLMKALVSCYLEQFSEVSIESSPHWLWSCLLIPHSTSWVHFPINTCTQVHAVGFSFGGPKLKNSLLLLYCKHIIVNHLLQKKLFPDS